MSQESKRWQSYEQEEARAKARATTVAKALVDGADPIASLVSHDQELENLPADVKRQYSINNPTRGERLAGLDDEGVAIHRITKSMETVEVETTIDHLLRHANNLQLGENVLNTAARILDEFNRQDPSAWNDNAARVRPRDAEPWAKMALKFLSDSKQFLIKRNTVSGTVEKTFAPDDLQAIERAGYETMARIRHLQKLAAACDQEEEDVE